MKLKFKMSIKKDSRPGPVSGHSDTDKGKILNKKKYILFQNHGPLINVNLDIFNSFYFISPSQI